VKRRCIFLDRDGVINVKPPEGEHVCRWEEFHIFPGFSDWIRLANALGYLVIVVSNQRAVARGLLRSEELDAIHARMIAELAQAGARIDGILFCPHKEGTCDCRKPRPGMVYRAQKQWNIDLAGSLLVGDSDCDRKLAEICGIPFIRVEGGRFEEIVLPRQKEVAGWVFR
jgi:D-glycero-D-manno-heptose 1,7-bisphosphate phosphatase